MQLPIQSSPLGTVPTDGIIHRLSPFSVADTVKRITEAIEGSGAKVFAVVDQDDEAENAGLSLRQTKLVIFGNPAGGTPVMQAAPLAALDLPLKILVWCDDAGTVWMTYVSADWLARRYGLDAELGKRLAAADALTGRISSSA
jgi:uncharacterized protein (DUF302 family)